MRALPLPWTSSTAPASGATRGDTLVEGAVLALDELDGARQLLRGAILRVEEASGTTITSGGLPLFGGTGSPSAPGDPAHGEMAGISPSVSCFGASPSRRGSLACRVKGVGWLVPVMGRCR